MLDIKWILVGCLVALSCLYVSTVFFLKKKEKGNMPSLQNAPVNDRDVEPTAHSDFSSAVNDWNEQLFTEQGDRSCKYHVTILLETGDSHAYDFYSYDDTLTKEFVLEERFYVNDYELLLEDEAGEHYINRKKIDQVDFMMTKISADQPRYKKRQQSQYQHSDEQSPSIFDDGDQWPEMDGYQPLDFTEKGPMISGEVKEEAQRFSKKKPIKLPALKSRREKIIDRLFLIVVLLILSSGIFALVRTFGIASRIEQLVASQPPLNESLSQTTGGSASSGFPFEMNLFLQTFIEHYIPLSNDGAAMADRAEQLRPFCVEEISFNSSPAPIKRTLVSSELSGIKESEGFVTACYKVTYELEVPTQQINGEGEMYMDYTFQEETIFLAMDVIQQGELFTIISYPYLKAVEQPFMEAQQLIREDSTEVLIVGEQAEEVQQFLSIFLSKYAEGATEELTYLMDETESLEEGYQLREIEHVQVFQQGQEFLAYVTVSFDKVSLGLVHTEAFSIKLVKENEQLRVKELRHNLGGF